MKYLLAALLGSTLITADIYVLDGDSIRADGQVYRLVGFDTPESGDRARPCRAKPHPLRTRAKRRIKQI